MTADGNGRDDRLHLDADSLQLVVKETRELIRSLEGTTASKVTIRSGALEIEVERAGASAGAVHVIAAPAHGSAAHAAVSPSPAASAPGLLPIVAPIVGVFYRAGSPGAKPFVEVGETVERGQQVGIVEAMKVMNEINSDYRGVVKEILVENGEAVQYEQPLMFIDPAGGSG